MSAELINALKEYEKMFNDWFPTIPLAWGRSDEEVIEIINECISKKKDVYDLEYLTLSEDVMY